MAETPATPATPATPLPPEAGVPPGVPLESLEASPTAAPAAGEPRTSDADRPRESSTMPPPWEATVSPVAAAPEPTAAVEPAVTPAAAAQAPPALTVTPSAAAPVSPPLPAPTPPAFATPAVAPLSLPTSAQAPAEPAGIATSLTVPPLEAAGAGEGGEWDLLVGKVRAWVEAAGFQGRWESLGVPLRSLGLLLAAVVILRIYGALLETLGDLPLLPRLLQLVGLFAFGQFCLTRLVRSSDRERILRTWRDNWKDFSGRG